MVLRSKNRRKVVWNADGWEIKTYWLMWRKRGGRGRGPWPGQLRPLPRASRGPAAAGPPLPPLPWTDVWRLKNKENIRMGKLNEWRTYCCRQREQCGTCPTGGRLPAAFSGQARPLRRTRWVRHSCSPPKQKEQQNWRHRRGNEDWRRTMVCPMNRRVTGRARPLTATTMARGTPSRTQPLKS